MVYVPRSPRRETQLRAIVDGSAVHARGRVRDMSTSGLFVETQGRLPLGAQVAVVPLVGELDGERLPAEVARVNERGIALRFVGLDAEHRQRLRGLLLGDGQSRLVRRPAPSRMKPPTVPSDAPVFLLTDEPTAELATAPAPVELGVDEEVEAQLLALGRRSAELEDENRKLRIQLHALEARLVVRQALEEELFTCYETVDELEKANDALVQALKNALR